MVSHLTFNQLLAGSNPVYDSKLGISIYTATQNLLKLALESKVDTGLTECGNRERASHVSH